MGVKFSHDDSLGMKGIADGRSLMFAGGTRGASHGAGGAGQWTGGAIHGAGGGGDPGCGGAAGPPGWGPLIGWPGGPGETVYVCCVG